MSEKKFNPGDKVNLKNNYDVVYIYLSDNGAKATCLTPDNREVEIHLVALMPYTPPSFF